MFYRKEIRNGEEDFTDMRGTIEFLREQEGELLVVKDPVDPVLEVAGIQVALEEGPAILFEDMKGYPGMRSVGNIFARRDRIAKIFDVEDWKQLKWKCLDAIKNPLAPVVVEDAPCQEVVYTGDDIDVLSLLPVLKHTTRDGARVMEYPYTSTPPVAKLLPTVFRCQPMEITSQRGVGTAAYIFSQP